MMHGWLPTTKRWYCSNGELTVGMSLLCFFMTSSMMVRYYIAWTVYITLYQRTKFTIIAYNPGHKYWNNYKFPTSPFPIIVLNDSLSSKSFSIVLNVSAKSKSFSIVMGVVGRVNNCLTGYILWKINEFHSFMARIYLFQNNLADFIASWKFNFQESAKISI